MQLSERLKIEAQLKELEKLNQKERELQEFFALPTDGSHAAKVSKTAALKAEVSKLRLKCDAVYARRPEDASDLFDFYSDYYDRLRSIVRMYDHNQAAAKMMELSEDLENYCTSEGL
tara:strand:+ start:298 stop:648 length:351 start_codon:yes stop_codon:yes gene_type:complete